LGQFYDLYALIGRFTALAGPLLRTLIVEVLGLGGPIALIIRLVLVLIAMAILRHCRRRSAEPSQQKRSHIPSAMPEPT
jgi:MFS-type transporter involved in bile tolerance (Atg22 family)